MMACIDLIAFFFQFLFYSIVECTMQDRFRGRIFLTKDTVLAKCAEISTATASQAITSVSEQAVRTRIYIYFIFLRDSALQSSV